MVKKTIHVTVLIDKWKDEGRENSDDLNELHKIFSDFVSQDPNDPTSSEYLDIEIVMPKENKKSDHTHMSFLTGLVRNIAYTHALEHEVFKEVDDDDLHHIYANESHIILNLQDAKIDQVIAWIKCLHTDGKTDTDPKPAIIRIERVVNKQESTE